MNCVPHTDGDGPRKLNAQDVTVAVKSIKGYVLGEIEGLGENPFVKDAITEAQAEQARDAQPSADGKFPQEEDGKPVGDRGERQEDLGPKEH